MATKICTYEEIARKTGLFAVAELNGLNNKCSSKQWADEFCAFTSNPNEYKVNDYISNNRLITLDDVTKQTPFLRLTNISSDVESVAYFNSKVNITNESIGFEHVEFAYDERVCQSSYVNTSLYGNPIEINSSDIVYVYYNTKNNNWIYKNQYNPGTYMW